MKSFQGVRGVRLKLAIIAKIENVVLYRCEGISTRGEMGADQVVQVQEGKQR